MCSGVRNLSIHALAYDSFWDNSEYVSAISVFICFLQAMKWVDIAFLTSFQMYSMGLRSGEYGDKKTRCMLSIFAYSRVSRA